MRVLCFIPARMASSRYPGKPLAPLLGLPLVLHVYRRCRMLAGVDEVIVTTCGLRKPLNICRSYRRMMI